MRFQYDPPTGPRLFGRGKGGDGGLASVEFVASMGPRLFRRGKFVGQVPGLGVGSASMGPRLNFHAKDRQAFANQLDRWLAAV